MRTRSPILPMTTPFCETPLGKLPYGWTYLLVKLSPRVGASTLSRYITTTRGGLHVTNIEVPEPTADIAVPSQSLLEISAKLLREAHVIAADSASEVVASGRLVEDISRASERYNGVLIVVLDGTLSDGIVRWKNERVWRPFVGAVFALEEGFRYRCDWAPADKRLITEGAVPWTVENM